jgi:hypothetical protein
VANAAFLKGQRKRRLWLLVLNFLNETVMAVIFSEHRTRFYKSLVAVLNQRKESRSSLANMINYLVHNLENTHWTLYMNVHYLQAFEIFMQI